VEVGELGAGVERVADPGRRGGAHAAAAERDRADRHEPIAAAIVPGATRPPTRAKLPPNAAPKILVRCEAVESNTIVSEPTPIAVKIEPMIRPTDEALATKPPIRAPKRSPRQKVHPTAGARGAVRQGAEVDE
jgi:hypothetical protein